VNLTTLPGLNLPFVDERRAPVPIWRNYLTALDRLLRTLNSLVTALPVGPLVTKAASSTALTAITVGPTDSSFILTGAGTITITLPAPAANPGRWLYLRSSVNQLVNSASANVGQLVGGTSSAILPATSGKWAALQSDGSVWNIMMAN
jgi:hypothetical protein